MVKHDVQAAMARAEQRAQAQAQVKEKETKAASGGWSVLAVQSIACVVIVLLALFARVAGGAPFEELRRGFADGMMRNDLIAVLTRMWDGDPLDAVTSDPLEEDAPTAPSATAPSSTTTTTSQPTTAPTAAPTVGGQSE